MFRLSRKGFTLVEIMIVVAIIALLAAIAIPNLLRARVNANQAAAQATLKSYATALEAYSTAGVGYPTAETDLTAPPSGQPYFARTMNSVTKGGYDYHVTSDGDSAGLAVGGYTIEAEANSEQTGGFHYQITTGARLRSAPSSADISGATWSDL